MAYSFGRRGVGLLFFIVCFCVIGCDTPQDLADLGGTLAPSLPKATFVTLVPTEVVVLTLPSPLVSTPSATPVPTETLPPTATLTPSTTPTASKTPRPTITLTPTVTLTPSVTPEREYACDDPGWPGYDRFWLSEDDWPLPKAEPETHFWLGKPLPPGVGRLLYNKTYPYGWDAYGLLLHNAVDVAAGFGTPVLAVADGTVIFARDDEDERHGWRCDWYGKFVTIEHDEKWQGHPVYSLYGHVADIEVEEGERVERGKQVATVGVGGAATAPHLHLEIRVGDNTFFDTRNPVLWLKPGKERGVIAGRIVDLRGRPWEGVTIWLIPEGEELDEDDQDLVTWSYLGDKFDIANPDEEFAENFTFGDLEPGVYTVMATLYETVFEREVVVVADEVVTVELLVPFRSR